MLEIYTALFLLLRYLVNDLSFSEVGYAILHITNLVAIPALAWL